MDGIKKFEDMIAWQKARILTRDIYVVTRQGAFVKDYALSRQIQRASVSIMSNLAEGFERSGLKEFQNFVSIAKSSCAEVRSHLYVAKDIQYLSSDNFKKLNSQAQEVARIVGGLRNSIIRKMRDSKATP